jgi:hypothetical protein
MQSFSYNIFPLCKCSWQLCTICVVAMFAIFRELNLLLCMGGTASKHTYMVTEDDEPAFETE